MLPRAQKPILRDFMLMQTQTRTRLCKDTSVFDPCVKLTELTSFEMSTIMSWYSDTNVDTGLNLYILLHYLSAVNHNSYYYHYVNNGNPDGTNMFGHVIGTSGSGKSSALTPHMDALNRTLSQLDIDEQYFQHVNKRIDLLFEQPFIVSNTTALQVFRSLIYGNRLLCSTECDTLLSNLGVYGNQYNDPRFAENVNMLIQMFDGTKHQNRATLSTSYNIPDGRRASIIGASVGDGYARVSQHHYEGNGVSGAHNRFTHYACPVMKAIKTNSGSNGLTSNMVPSLQHVYSVSYLLGKVEYVPRHNVYDRCKEKKSNAIHPDVEEKFNRLRPTADRQYRHLSSRVEMEFEEPEDDASYEHKATETEKQEHEAIISFKNSAKIPRFICNFARFRTIMDILWDDDVYPLIEVSQVIKSPYRVSDAFIEAAKKVIEQRFPANLRTADGTKIVIIEKSTAIMGDLFFGHVDYVSRQLFDLSSIQEKFNTLPVVSQQLNSSNMEAKNFDEAIVYGDASTILSSKFIFFSLSTFSGLRQFHNDKGRLTTAINYLVDNGLLFQSLNKNRFIKGTRWSYSMATPNQIKQNDMSIEALINLKLNINKYEQLWKECLLSTYDIPSKIDKSAIDLIKSNLIDYIPIIHRLGDSKDPIAQEILKPGLLNGQIGINHETNTFSLLPEYMLQTKNDDYVMGLLNNLCSANIAEKNDSSRNEKTSTTINQHRINNNEIIMIDSSESNNVNTSSPLADDVQRLQTQFQSSSISTDILSTKIHQTDNPEKQTLFSEKANETVSMSIMHSVMIDECLNVLDALESELEYNHVKEKTVNNDLEIIRNTNYTNNSKPDVNNSLPIALKSIIVEDMSTSDKMNINTTSDLSSSVEYDYPIDVPMNIHTTDTSLQKQQQQKQQNQELFPENLSSIATEGGITEYHDYSESNSMETDFHFDLQVTSSPNKTSTRSETEPNEIAKLISLSKRLMLKPFIAFTQTDVTRLFNNAETKNSVIAYLKHNKLIKEIPDLFISSVPTKKTIKYETGYLKTFPASESASDTSTFESKLRQIVGIGLDEYTDKVLDNEKLSTGSPVVNNIFNTTHHNWLLNRHWYNKIKAGEINIYYPNKVKCLEENISSISVPTATLSNDNVTDSFDQPRSSLTSTQRTAKELRRLGVKRQKKSNEEPLPKRQRKPKRFSDDDQ